MWALLCIIMFMLAVLGIIGFLDSWVDVIPNFSCHGNKNKIVHWIKQGAWELDHPWFHCSPIGLRSYLSYIISNIVMISQISGQIILQKLWETTIAIANTGKYFIKVVLLCVCLSRDSITNSNTKRRVGHIFSNEVLALYLHTGILITWEPLQLLGVTVIIEIQVPSSSVVLAIFLLLSD